MLMALWIQNQFHISDLFVCQFEGIDETCKAYDSRAMLVIMEDWDFHELSELSLDIEAVRCFDIFQVNAAKRWSKALDTVDELVWILSIDTYVD